MKALIYKESNTIQQLCRQHRVLSKPLQFKHCGACSYLLLGTRLQLTSLTPSDIRYWTICNRNNNTEVTLQEESVVFWNRLNWQNIITGDAFWTRVNLECPLKTGNFMEISEFQGGGCYNLQRLTLGDMYHKFERRVASLLRFFNLLD